MYSSKFGGGRFLKCCRCSAWERIKDYELVRVISAEVTEKARNFSEMKHILEDFISSISVNRNYYNSTDNRC
jgi:hypothetical protein